MRIIFLEKVKSHNQVSIISTSHPSPNSVSGKASQSLSAQKCQFWPGCSYFMHWSAASEDESASLAVSLESWPALPMGFLPLPLLAGCRQVPSPFQKSG